MSFRYICEICYRCFPPIDIFPFSENYHQYFRPFSLSGSMFDHISITDMHTYPPPPQLPSYPPTHSHSPPPPILLLSPNVPLEWEWRAKNCFIQIAVGRVLGALFGYRLAVLLYRERKGAAKCTSFHFQLMGGKNYTAQRIKIAITIEQSHLKQQRLIKTL